eukprot:786836-Pleurochrysis_carterae.AAC.2
MGRPRAFTTSARGTIHKRNVGSRVLAAAGVTYAVHKALLKALREKEAELQRGQVNFRSEMDHHVRASVRHQLGERDVAVFGLLASLKADLHAARRAAVENRKKTVRLSQLCDLQTKVAERDKQISDLTKKLAASDDGQLQWCRKKLAEASDVSANRFNNMRSRGAELRHLEAKMASAQKAHASEQKRQRVELMEDARREAAQKAAADAQRESAERIAQHEQAESAARIAVLLEAEVSRQKEIADAIARNGEEGMEEMFQKERVNMQRAVGRFAELEQQLCAAESARMPSALRAHDAEEFAQLAASSQRSARARDMDYAEWFLSQREWRCEDWITVFFRQGGWLQALWESEEVWA